MPVEFDDRSLRIIGNEFVALEFYDDDRALQQTIYLQDDNTLNIGGISTSSSSGTGVSGGAPAAAQYLVLAGNADLINERILTPGDGLTGTDAGPDGAYTLDVGVFTDAAELTIDDGEIEVTQVYHSVDTESDGASDELDTISGGLAGQVLILRAEHDDRTVVLKHGSDNIQLASGQDATLDDANDHIILVYDGTDWNDVGGVDVIAIGGAPALTYTTANAEGTAASFVRTDAELAVFDATNPTTIECDDSAATGSAAFAARRDHAHAIACAAPTTDVSAASSNAEGDATSFARSNHAHALDVSGVDLDDLASTSLADPDADRIVFWDDSDGAYEWLTPGNGLGITTNTLAVDHDDADNFDANEHVDHTAVTLTAGDGLTGGGDISASRTFAVGAGDGLTVNADDVALTTPGTCTVATSNDASGNHTHELTTSSNPGAAASVLASDASGYLQLTGLGVGAAPGEQVLMAAVNIKLDDGAGDSPQLIFYGGSNDDAVIMRLLDDGTAGDSDFKIQLCDAAGDSHLLIQDSDTATVWSVNSDGNQTMVDNAWLGLGAAAGRIEFDNQTTDEVNILNAYVGINTSTPGRPLAVVMDAPANTHTGCFIDGTAHIGVALGELDGEASIQGFDDDESAPDRWIDLVINKAGGDVGIGTTPNADRKLHVNSGATNVVAHFESSDNRALITFADNSTTNDNTSGIGTDADVLFLYTGGARQIFVNSDGDLMVGTTTSPSANGGAVLVFADNANDPTMDTNTAGFYAKDVSGTVEAFCVDEADNATQLSPHDPDTGEWVFYSRNLRTGRELRVDMERLMKALNEMLGGGYVHEGRAP